MKFALPALILLATSAPGVHSLLGQSKQPKRTAKAAPKKYEYTITFKGKSYDVTCLKPLPHTELGQALRDGLEAPQLRDKIRNSESRVVSLESTADSLRFSLSTARSSLEELALKVSEAEDERDELQDKLAALESDIGSIQIEMSSVNSSMASLKRTIRDFGYYDWKVVVPDVERKARNLERDLSSLESLIDSLDP